MTKYFSGGFDLRFRAELLPEDPGLADQFLVPENRNRITADGLVWPSPKEVDDFLMSQPISHPLGLSNNLHGFLPALREHGIATVNLTPVCLTLSETTVRTLCNQGWAFDFKHAPCEEDLLGLGWRFLGFDTAELNGLCSGLKGIGYNERSRSQLRPQFGDALNDVGLFSDAVIASQFAGIRGKQIPSQAPFEVVGILVHDLLRA